MFFRILLIICNTSLIFLSFQFKNFIATPYILIAILIIQIILLINNQKVKEDKIISHLENILLDGKSTTAKENSNNIFSRMENVIDNIRIEISNSNQTNEKQANLFNNLLDHIAIGLISFNRSGDIDIENRSARFLLSENYLSNLKDIKTLSRNEIDELLNFSKPVKRIFILENSSLFFESSDIVIDENPIRILSLQNIDDALDKKEMDSWNKIVRTLNHEIMNSITPISSLASSALLLINDNVDHDLVEAVKTIERRSQNLLKFIENFKRLSQIPTPKKEVIQISDLLLKIEQLFKPILAANNINFQLSIKDTNMEIYADPTLIEQILINLVKNSQEANSTLISLESDYDKNNRVIISTTDNGSGFSSESKQNAFIPFYTTKPSGSGLGLSIVKQIIHQHNADIEIISNDNGSIVNLIF